MSNEDDGSLVVDDQQMRRLSSLQPGDQVYTPSGPGVVEAVTAQGVTVKVQDAEVHFGSDLDAHRQKVCRNNCPSKEGRKNDGGKLQYGLIPPYMLQELAKTYTIGANKYAPHNWELGFAWSRAIDAAMRHFFAWRTGETTDPEDGQHHLAAAIFNLTALMCFEKYNLGTDDRSKLETSHV